MTLFPKKKIVLLGMMSRIPVAGVVWQYMHYILGFRRLGFDVYYVEAHGRTPTMLMEHPQDDATAKAVAFIAESMKRFDMSDRWAFHALHADGECYGLSSQQLLALYASADLLINVHGGTHPLPEHYATGRLVYLETDPVELQIELFNHVQESIDFLEPHCAFFTFGENYGTSGCKLPVSERFRFLPTRQPVVIDQWSDHPFQGGECFTTVGNWNQNCRKLKFQGETYYWSKHYEFLKVIDLPSRTDQPFELALGSYQESDQRMLQDKGWRVRHAMGFSMEIDPYREYIQTSRGEFTVAKDQNVRLRTGWFSDRSATYLAAGRPVITQETGFSDVLPTGEGLFGFSSLDEALAAVDSINSHYTRHCQAAGQLAREYFAHDSVLPPMLAAVGL